MKRTALVAAAALLSTFAMQGAHASTGTTGNGAPSGSHYNLNLVGVDKGKTAPMTGSDGHVIFTNLYGNSKIYLQEGPSFQVLDANGTDANGATFQMPNPDPTGSGYTTYSVFARALGKPGGSGSLTSCFIDSTTGDTYCSTETTVLVANSGKNSFSNVSKELLTVCLDTNGDGTCDTRVPLFSDSTDQYLWSYDNNGLRLAQLRFYPTSTNVGTTP